MQIRDLEIIYEDKDLLAVNKPPGIVVFHEPFLKEEEKKKMSLSLLVAKKFPEVSGVGKERNGAVHRLDKDTSGVLLFAKNEKTLSFLQNELLEQNAKKGYIALVFKVLKKDEGKIDAPLARSPKDRRKQKAYTRLDQKRAATTFFRTIERFKNYSLLEVEIETGRKHQIRCHLSSIGHPIAGDKLYRFKDQIDPEGLERQFLHSKSIEIKTPSGKKCFEATLYEDLKKVLTRIRSLDSKKTI